MSVTRIRSMTAADLAGVRALAASIAEAPVWSESAWETTLRSRDEGIRLVLVAEAEGAIKGFAIFSILAPEAELELIAVAESARRQGLASRFFATSKEQLKGTGVTEILLEVRASNEAALGFYLREGFVTQGRRKGYYIDPVEDALLMRLILEPPR